MHSNNILSKSNNIVNLHSTPLVSQSISTTEDTPSSTGISNPQRLDSTHRDIILASIASFRNMTWLPDTGLSDQSSNTVITNNPNEIAKNLLGLSATSKNLEDAESIIDYVIRLPNYEELIQSAREVLKKYNIKLPIANQLESYTPGSSAWFRRMIEFVT